ncbi:MAG: type III secretion system cytoplasmic ring protein SctQ [Deltaproteobacteria bacterium]|jgi:type III secretion protein Q|nr:type III secretion system cytoplasmic ring protein SctQ [Deltaproteobacteria bacterium]
MSGEPFVIPPLPPKLARLCSRLSRRELLFSLSLGGKNLRLYPELAAVALSPAEIPAPSGEEVLLPLSLGGEYWLIRIYGPAAETLLAPPEGLNPEDIPEELRPALRELSLEPLLDRISAALGRKALLTEKYVPEKTKESFILPFKLFFTAEGGPETPAGGGEAHIPLSTATLALLGDLGKTLPRRPPADISALPLSLSLCAGKESFPLSLLRAAEPGDVLLFAVPAGGTYIPLTLELNNHALWTAALTDGAVTLKSALAGPPPQELIMSSTPEDKSSAPSRQVKAEAPEETPGSGLSEAEIDALELTLSLELAEIRLSLGELAALAPGQTLETTASPEAPITIKANGKPVGKGRLVEVGDRLGVLVSSLSPGATDGEAREDEK